ncbi:NUDIX domain-containing protein [Cellulosimicrobium terreum]|nr:NUDIX domain-containing protein [Cellulosimicrobium terreum]
MTSGTPSSPSPEWVLGDDGLYFRRAARVLLVDAADRLLLVRGHDVDQPERSWWFTVGGGVDEGEDELAAAVREVQEETGLVLDPSALAGPVWTRSAIFDFYRWHCRQDEVFYLARLDGDVAEGDALSRDGWTDIELDVVDELRWWSLAELRQVEIEVFPAGLVDLVEPLLTGWDGVIRHLGLAREH